MHALSEEIWCHRTSASACFFGNDRSSRSRVRTRLITKCVSYEWASDSFAYPCPCKTRGTLARTHQFKKARSPKLKMLEPLCNQTVNLEKDAKTLHYWQHAQLHCNSFVTISDARYLPLSTPKTLTLAPQCYSNAERWQITMLRLKTLINAVWLTFYWSPTDA